MRVMISLLVAYVLVRTLWLYVHILYVKCIVLYVHYTKLLYHHQFSIVQLVLLEERGVLYMHSFSVTQKRRPKVD